LKPPYPIAALLTSFGTPPAAVPVALAAAELLAAVVVDAGNDATIETAPFTPDAGDRIVVIAMARDGSAGTFGTPVAAGFSLSTAFTSRASDDETTAQYYAVQAWDGVVGTGVEGTVSVTASQAQFQQVLLALKVPGAAAFQAKGQASNATGTGLDIDYDGDPDLSASCGIVAVLQQSAGGTTRSVTGYAELDAGTQGSNLAWFLGTDLNSPPDPAAASGWASNQAHVGVVLAYTGS
jgi:hypothetical protein